MNQANLRRGERADTPSGDSVPGGSPGAGAGLGEDPSSASATPSLPAISVEQLYVRLGSETVLEDVSFDVPRGDFLGIIGPNGAGKTVLLRSILGQISPSGGRIRIFGSPIRQARGRISYVPQFAEFDRSFPIRVRDVVLMGRIHERGILRRWTREDREVAYNVLARVDLAHLGERQIGRLSGGELQRVLIARALAVGSEILLLDEPSASLDTRVAGRLYELLSDLSSSHTLVLISHDIGVMSRHVKSLICLNRRILHHGPPEFSAEALHRTYGHTVEEISHDHDHDQAHDHPHDHAHAHSDGELR